MSTAPTIGRVVHYRSYGSADGRYEAMCRTALVTETHDDNHVGLAVLNPTGLFFDRDVRLSDEHTGGTWHWPCVITTNEEQTPDGQPEDR